MMADTVKSREGFVVVEVGRSGFRYWFWDSNVDAEQFKEQAEGTAKQFKSPCSYTIRRADVAELQ